MDGRSLDITKMNVDLLEQSFPEVVTDGKIDFDKLRLILGEGVEDSEERYDFTWHGKKQAIKIAQTPSVGTLRPCKEESKEWDTTENLYIEGDNLEVLKLLQKSYFGKVRMVYIDPPYNTGNDFVYSDNYSDNIENYLEMTGQTDDDRKKISTNPEYDGRFHTNWLNMMYPRLKLARNLLMDNGIIFISIDDNEVDNLRKLCDTIFGEDNFRNQIIVRRGAKSVQAQFDTWDKLGQDIEYLLFYTKNASYRFPKQLKKLGEKRQGSWNNHWRGTDRPTMRYSLFGLKPETGQWRWGKERSLKAIENYKNLLAQLSETEDTITQEKIDLYYLSLQNEIDLLRLSKNGKPEHYIAPTDSTLLNSSWYDLLIGSSSEILDLFDEKVFDTAKLTSVIARMLGFCDREAIILDFFSGSATTAHAVMQLNVEDHGDRRFIMIQLPEPTEEKSEAHKAGYKDICEIGKERIRRAGAKIKAECDKQTGLNVFTGGGGRQSLDVGFKVFKLDSSNIKKWNAGADLKATILDYQDNLRTDAGRTDLDIVYEIILKMGLPLTSTIDTVDINGKTIFSISSGSLMACLDYVDSTDIAAEMVAIYKKENPEEDDSSVWKVVFKDSGFSDDSVKANTKETLKAGGLKDGSFITL